MMKPTLLLIGMAVAFLPATALCDPTIASWPSSLRDLARGCRTLDLRHWSHPTRGVLEHADIAIKEVDLCNSGLYPVFTVALKYDLNGPNDSYYNRLYWALAQANGFHSFSLVDTGLA